MKRQTMKNNRDKIKGITLIELLVAMAILSIIVSFAAPSYHDTFVRYNLSDTTIKFMSALNYTRSEAVRLGKSVVFCKTENGTSCTQQGQWEAGWLSFVDDNKNDILDTGETILRSWPALDDAYSLRATSTLANILRYSPLGDLNNIDDTETFVLCHRNKLDGARSVSINRLRPRIGDDTNNDGIPEKINGANSLNITSCSNP